MKGWVKSLLILLSAFAEVQPFPERTLPEIDIVFPGKHLVGNEFHGKGETMAPTGALWSNCSQLFFKLYSVEECWVAIHFEAKRKESRRLVVKLIKSYDNGVHNLYLDGIRVKAGIDLYSEDTDVEEFPILGFWPEAGMYKVRLVFPGKKALSKDCWHDVDSIRLRVLRPRLDEYG